MSDLKKPQKEISKAEKKKLQAARTFSLLEKGMQQINPFSGTPFEITREEAERFKDRDPMDLYHWLWQHL